MLAKLARKALAHAKVVGKTLLTGTEALAGELLFGDDFAMSATWILATVGRELVPDFMVKNSRAKNSGQLRKAPLKVFS